MEKETLLTIGLVLLVLIGAVQGVQIYSLQDRLGGSISDSSVPVSLPQSQQSDLPSGLQSLPQQVGGC